jgi:hypothetical protein
MTKVCSVCKKELSKGDFYTDKTTLDNLRDKCKECFNRKSIEYRRSRKGIVTQIWHKQKVNSIERGHPLPNYTKEELANWMFNQETFTILYVNWIKSGYERLLSVTCDRIDSRKPYSLDNLRLVTFKENHLAENTEMKMGIIGRAKPVQGENIITGERINFISASEAERKIGVHKSHVQACANFKRKTTGGYYWRYL